jgi:hypothetical protein
MVCVIPTYGLCGEWVVSSYLRGPSQRTAVKELQLIIDVYLYDSRTVLVVENITWEYWRFKFASSSCTVSSSAIPPVNCKQDFQRNIIKSTPRLP